MAKKRFLNSDIWTNNKYFRSLNKTEALLYIYLLTNRDIEYYGVMDCYPPKIADETNIDVTEVAKILDKFQKDGVIIVEKYKLFVQGFIPLQGQVNKVTVNKFNAESYKLPPKIRQAALTGLEGGSAPPPLGGSEPPTELINNSKDLREKREHLNNNKEGEIPVVFQGNQIPPTTETEGKEDIDLQVNRESYSGQSEENIAGLTQQLQSSDNSDLINRISNKFKEVFGWTGDPFGSKHAHFVKSAEKIYKLAGPKIQFQNNIIEYFMMALEDWAKRGFEKIISTGHLCSEDIWAGIFPQYLKRKWMTLEDLDEDNL